jgi:protoporphyrinogen oxidase
VTKNGDVSTAINSSRSIDRPARTVAILGAGFGGMSAAYDLARHGCKVTIYESESFTGGLAAGFKEPHWDWYVEKFYHHWFASDKHMLNLIRELGWQDQVLFPRPYTVIYHQGRFYPFDSVPAAAFFPGLGWGIDKVRFGLVGLYLKLTNNWRLLERTTVDAWMRKWAGDKVYEMMWEPLMLGKFSEKYARQVNMAWMWARLKARTTRLGTFWGGFQAFADRFAEYLKAIGVDIRLETPVKKITQLAEGGISLETAQGMAHHNQCLVTTSPGLFARLAPDLPRSYLQGLLDLKSMGAVVMVLALKQRLSEQGYYWFNIPKTAGYPFLALVEHTNFLSPQYFGGDHIVYVGDYLDPSHEYFHLSPEGLLERFLPVLPHFNPQFRPDWIRKTWLFRTAYAQPVSLVGHSSNIPPIPTPIPGLYFASMSQVYPWDRGTNFAVEIGRRAAAMMLAQS